MYNNNFPNYHYEDIMGAIELYEQSKLVNPAIIIDTNHSNSGKKYLEQIRIAKEVFGNMKWNGMIMKYVKGLLIESYIEDGAQSPSGNVYGQSVTDSCIGWDKTERLIYDLAEMI